MGTLIQLKPGATLLDFPAAAQSFRLTLAAALKRHRLPEHLIEALIREGEVQPDATPEDGLAWARSFSGLLVTCGLDHTLSPC